MKKKTLFALFGFLFGLCGVFCFVNTSFQTQASSTSASVWDGKSVSNADDLKPGEWYYNDSEYHINSAAAFSYFANQVNSNSFANTTVFLETDIDLAGKNWTPIGGSDHTFQGTFDGKGHYIFGLMNIQSTSTHAGLFGIVAGNGKIENLNLRNVSYSGSATYVGSIAGEMSSNIENCSVEGSLRASGSANQCVGGLVGKLSNATIKNSSAKVSINLSSTDANSSFGGGLAGTVNEVAIENSYSSGEITAAENMIGNVGGLVGTMSGSCSIKNSFSNMNMNCANQGSGKIGGLVGLSTGSLTIENAYHSGKINFKTAMALYVGGIVGYVGQTNGQSSTATLKNLLMLATMTINTLGDGSNHVSPLWSNDVGTSVTAEHVWFDAETLSDNFPQNGNQDKAVKNLCTLAKTRDFYRNTKYFDEDWDFDKTWRFGSENNGFPSFRFVAGQYTKNDFGNGDQDTSNKDDFRGEGTAQSPYLLSTAGDLARLSEKINAGEYSGKVSETPSGTSETKYYYFSLENDINLAGKTWVPIGDDKNAFSGVFDGNGHTIFGVSCSNQNTFAYHGLFGRTQNAVIKNLTVSGFSLTSGSTATGNIVASVAGNIVASVAGNTYLVNCLDKDAEKTDAKNSVGAIKGGKLYVLLGKNNKNDCSTNKQKLNSLKISNVSFFRGFDVAISGEGGNFYAPKTASGETTTADNLTEALYLGEYHILLDEGGKVVDVSNIDATFGETALPGLSKNLGSKDVLMKRGSKLEGYKLQSGKVWTVSTDEKATESWTDDFSLIDKSSLVDGLVAVWEENAEKTIRVVFNAYEKAKFGATANNNAPYINQNLKAADGQELKNYKNQNITIKLGEEGGEAGLVYVDYVLEYDAFLSESEYIFDAPLFSAYGKVQGLRGDDFEMVGIFEKEEEVKEQFAFGEQEVKEQFAFGEQFEKPDTAMFVNDNLNDVYYAQWKGKEDKNHTAKVVFKTEDKGITDLSAAVKSVTLSGGYDNDGDKDAVEISATQQGSGQKASNGDFNFAFQYNTLFSDKRENFLSFEIQLNDGYVLAANLLNDGYVLAANLQFDQDKFDETAYDKNFGVPTISANTFKNVTSIEQFNNLQFFNLLGEHTFTFTIEREKYEDDVVISDEEIFVGIGPSDDVTISKNGDNTYTSNVQIGASIHDNKDLIEYVKEKYKKEKADVEEEFDWNAYWEALSKEQNLHIAFDLVHGRILFSSTKYDAIEMDFPETGIYLKIDEKAYTLKKSGQDKLWDITLHNESRSVDEVKFTFDQNTPSSSKIEYQAFNSFVMLFSTEYINSEESDSVSFTDVGPVYPAYSNAGSKDEAISGTPLKKFVEEGKEGEKPTKYMVEFKSAYHPKSDKNKEGKKDTIYVVTEYTKASFSFKFVHHDKTTEMGKNSPTLVWDSGRDVETGTESGGTISFVIESSDRFRLFGEESVVLFSNGKQTGIPDTQGTYNIKISVESGTVKEDETPDVQADAQDNYVADLNDVNGLYFGSHIEGKQQSVTSHKKGTQFSETDFSHTFANDGFKIEIGYSEQLRAGKYEIEIVCTDQLYEVEYATKFVKQSEVATDPDLATLVEGFKTDENHNENDSNKTDENHNENGSKKVTTSAHFTSGEQRHEAAEAEQNKGKLENLKFDDQLSLNTTLGDDKGYVFYRWIVQSEGQNRTYTTPQVDKTLSKVYMDSEVGEGGSAVADQFKLYAFAVYQRKQATISLAPRVQIEDETISMEEAQRRGLAFAMESKTYIYGTDKGPEKMEITMSGDNANGYYLDGFSVIYTSGNELLENGQKIYDEYHADADNGATTKQISIDMGWLKEAISRERLLKNNALSDTFQIVPILKKKTATLFFHSGTGGVENEYGDKLNGHVFDISNEETTSNTYSVSQTYKFGERVDISSLMPTLDGQQQNRSIESLFNNRTGYSLAQNYWAWKANGNQGTLSLSYLSLFADMFAGETKETEIHIYRLWVANQYSVVFHTNTGTFKSNPQYEQISVLFTYDQTYNADAMTKLLTDAKIMPIEKTGYHLLGWNLQDSGTQIFDAAGKVVENSEFFKDEKFVHTTSFDVYAQWQANKYDIEIFFNKADSVAGQEGEKTSARFSLAYDSRLSLFEIGSGLTGIDNFTKSNVTRAGFVFDGVFAYDENTDTKTKITNTFVFNTSFPTFKLPNQENELAVTLYFAWTFDETYFSMSVRNNLPNLTFNDQEQTVELASYFAPGNYAATGFDIDTDGDTLISLSSAVKSITLSIGLSSTTGATIGSDQKSFKVKNVGKYSIEMTLTLTDLEHTGNNVIDNHFNLGQLQQIVVVFEIEVQGAKLDLKDEFEDGLYLQNLKKLVSVYLPNTGENSLRKRLVEAESLSSAIEVLKEFDHSVSEKSNDEIYQYFMTRFYLLSHTTETSAQNIQYATLLYKNWTYESFETYKTQNASRYQEILEKTLFFGFYDFQNLTQSIALNDFSEKDDSSFAKYVSLQAESTFDPANLKVSKIEIVDTYFTLRAGNTYSLRVYVTASEDVLKNYVLEKNESGEYYFVARSAQGYVFPQILSLENSSQTKQVYYSSWYGTSRDVPWQTSGESKEIEGLTFHLLDNLNGEKVFVYAQIQTSNIGKFDEDTTFRYTDKTNYLTFSTVRVLIEKTDDYIDITSNFKFVLDDENYFVIKSTKEVANIRARAMYLTRDYGATIFQELPQDLYPSTLSITSVKYDGQEAKLKDLEDGTVFTKEGEIMFEVVTNNANDVEIFVGKAVEEVTFAVQSLNAGDFVSLYDWTRESVTKISGSMTQQSSYSIKQEEILEKSQNAEDEVAQIDLFAVFTDLVKATYDYGFPEGFKDFETTETVLKLGQPVTDDLVPYVSGLGDASSLYAKKEDGTLAPYTELNNYELGDLTVFGGWNNSTDSTGVEFRFAPVTLVPKWTVPDTIEHESMPEEIKVAVFTFSSISANDLLQLKNTNEEIFDYEFSWKVEYDDNSQNFTSTDMVINLRDNGGTTASGTYTLTVTRRVKQAFVEAKTFEGKTETTISESVKIEFMPIKLIEVQTPQDATAQYNGKDHKNDENFVVTVKYVEFDNATQEYKTEQTTQEVRYAETGLFTFGITFGGSSATEIVNVGEYNVTMNFLAHMFSLQDLHQENVTFTYTITPLTFDLKDFVQDVQKSFNFDDPEMTQNIQVLDNVFITIKFSRDGDEDIGEKGLFVEDVLNDVKNNVDFTFDSHDVFKDGHKVENAPAVGKFVIAASGTLRIDLSGDSLVGDKVTAEYTGQAYTPSLNELTLTISNGKVGAQSITLNISLFDETKGEDLTGENSDVSANGRRQKILEILKKHLSEITAQFFRSSAVQAIDAGTYSFHFEAGEKFSKYYSNVTIDGKYKFEITPHEIKLNSLNLDKEYDGQIKNLLDVEGFDDIQLEVTYASRFVGENIPVTLNIVPKGEAGSNVANFVPESRTSHANITKATATLTLKLKDDKNGKFTYGTLNENSLSEYFEIAKINNQKLGEISDKNALDNILAAGRYHISYSLVADSKNARGFLYKGHYTAKTNGESISITADFYDFEMTIETISFEIEALTKELTIDGTIKTITDDESFTSFDYPFAIAETGDNLTLKLGAEPNTVFEAGKQYALKILNGVDSSEDYYAKDIQGSIVVTIDADKGLNVVSKTGTVVLTIKETLEAGEYDGHTYHIEFDLTTSGTELAFYIKNDNDYTSKKYTLTATSEGSSFDGTGFSLQLMFAEKEVKNAGLYRITLSATESDGYNFVFAQEYVFQITKKKIKASALKNFFDKEYDGSALTEKSLSAEKGGIVAGEEVLVSGRFENANAGDNKKVFLDKLSGRGAANYEIAANDQHTTSTISKAKAKITHSGSTEFVYGSLSKGNLLTALGLSVVAAKDSTPLAQSLYALEISSNDIDSDENYSSRGFLKVKESGYQINVSAGAASSTNYEFQPLELQITVTPFGLELSFSDVIKSVEYGDEDWKKILAEGGKFEYEYPAIQNSLAESVILKLQVENFGTGAVKKYRISSQGCTSLDENYVISSVSDTSTDGAFEVVKPRNLVYVLFDKSDIQTVEDRISASTTYDGKEYDSVELVQKNGEWWLILKSSSTSAQKDLAKLAFFTYSGSEYVKYESAVIGLEATFSLSQNVHFVTTSDIEIYVQDASSQSNQIKFGLYEFRRYAYLLSVEKQKLYFKSGASLKTPFNNQEVVLEFENASEILNGIVSGEALSLSVKFLNEDGSGAKFFSPTPYSISPTLSGETAEQYEVIAKYSNDEGQAVTGTIDRAEISVNLFTKQVIYGENYSFEYGTDYEFDFGDLGDFDLDAYRAQGRKFEFKVELTDTHLSTSGHLKVGDYGAKISIGEENCDFRLLKVYVNGADDIQITNSAVLTVVKKQLTLDKKENGKSLQEIFTREYDEEKGTKADIFEEGSQNLLFKLVGIVSKDGKTDDVKLFSARFSSDRGVGLQVTFTIDTGCADGGNYEVQPYSNGTIKAVKVLIEFEFEKDGITTDATGELIAALAYPLVYDEFLTSNSFDPNTNKDGNFPHSLSGKVGYNFTHWSLDIELSENAETKKQQIATLQHLKNSGIEMDDLSDAITTVHIVVGNDRNTVSLLRELLKDDTFGLYFKNKDTKIVFHENWEAEKYDLTIEIADENGGAPKMPMGKVTFDGSGDIESSKTFEKQFTYGQGPEITLKAIANDHVFFDSFWLDGTKIEGNVEGVANFSIVDENGQKCLKISNVVKDIKIVVRFRLQKVTITLDVEGEIKEHLQVGGNWFDENFVWRTDFFAVKDLTYSVLDLQLVGRTLRAFQVGEQEISKEAFETTKLVNASDLEGDIDLHLKPLFDANCVTISLDFGYENKTEEIFVDFGSAYSTAKDENGDEVWSKIENPEREGWKFLGWYLGEEKISGDTLVLAESIELVAKWEAIPYSVTITLENVDVLSFPSGLEEKDGKLVVKGESPHLNDTFTFVIVAKEGYFLPEADEPNAENKFWDERFTVVLDNGQATITFKIAAEDFVAKISASPRENLIKFSGEHIESVVVTVEQQNIDVQTENGTSSFKLFTGKIASLEISPESGYDVLPQIVLKNSNGEIADESTLGISTSVITTEEGKLVLNLEGTKCDFEIVFQTKVRQNTITIGFENTDTIERISVEAGNGQVEYSKPTNSVVVQVETGKELTLFVDFAHGYEWNELVLNDGFDPAKISAETSLEASGRCKIVLKGIVSDATIEIKSKPKQYKITLNVISLGFERDEDGNVVQPEILKRQEISENTLTSDGQKEITIDFGTKLTLALSNKGGFDFVGWNTRDEEVALEENALKAAGFEKIGDVWTYLVTDNASIWAIFSEYQYHITLKTLDYAQVDAHNSTIQNPFVEIEGTYFDGEDEISDLAIYYGQSMTIKFEVPDDYKFAGFGIFDEEGNLKQLSTQVRQEKEVDVTIVPSQFGSTKVDKVYMLVISDPSTISVSSRISYGTLYEQNFDVGGIELCDENGNGVNAFGYIEGSRVHYDANEFENGQVLDPFAFKVIAYKQLSERDDIFLKVLSPREGYSFDRIETNGLSYQEVSKTEEYTIYKIMGLLRKADDWQIVIYYAPNLNAVDISFVHNGEETYGGAIDVETPQSDIRKLWTSGNGYTKISVAAYTDVQFSVSVLIRAGFYVDENSIEACIEDENGIVVSGSVRYHVMSVETTGFVGEITFDVQDFVGINQIKIKLLETKYVVVFKEDEKVLAKVHNVGFDTNLQGHLLEANAQNIEIFDANFTNGKLNLVRTLQEHHFEGYFTHQNGAGKHYINSDGNAVGTWQESGYEYNPFTGKFELQSNAVLGEDGIVEISLYLYMSYYKTRMNFNFVPSININFTAQDMVEGVNEENSWFYGANPTYIEISFNTDIYINAPQINGYKFHRFVINQRNFEGDWLTPAYFYQERMPWSTNEFDRIVECRIDIEYFAQLDVKISGGEGRFVLSQDVEDTQAQELLEEGFFDTTKELTVSAEPNEGYSFAKWEYLGQTSMTKEIKFSSAQRLSIEMFLQGQEVTLDFGDYDTTNGQIVGLDIVQNSGVKTHVGNLITFSGGKFVKNKTRVSVHVGDEVTFIVSMTEAMAVDWNRSDISFKEYKAGLNYFVMTLTGESAGATLKIIPKFSNAYRSVFVSSSFAQEEILSNALDDNNIDYALTVFAHGQKGDKFVFERGNNVEIDIFTNPRYKVESISIKSVGTNLTDMSLFFKDGKLVLDEAFMSAHQFGGNIYVSIKISRLMWEDAEIETDAFEGAGTAKNPYHIKSQEDLLLMMKLVNTGEINSRGRAYSTCAYVLDKDINLAERFWTPIGTTQFAFDGSFNFANHVVRDINLSVFYEQISYNGLFGVLGANANISKGSLAWWWILLIILLSLALVFLLVSLIYYNKKKKKEREEMAKR